MDAPKVVLITGASSGFGQATARLLAAQGYTVFGTSRKPSQAQPIPGVAMLELDVRSDDSVAACIDSVVEAAGRLDVLVNNAGYVLAGAVEEATVEEVRSEFETNFFGVHRMVRAALPIMRKQRSGTIVNIGSVAGFSAGPFMGIYSATKFALEGYSEALRIEVTPFNIHVSLVEIGFARTNIGRNAQLPLQTVDSYNTSRQRALNCMMRRIERGATPRQVAERILRIVRCRAPKLRYRVGREAVGTAIGRWVSTESLFEQGVRKYFDLK